MIRPGPWGHIAVQSEPDMGCLFKIYLPACEEGAGGEKADLKPAAEAERGTETILLLEADVIVKSFFRQALERSGYQILEAQGPEEALDIVRLHGERVRLLITESPVATSTAPDRRPVEISQSRNGYLKPAIRGMR